MTFKSATQRANSIWRGPELKHNDFVSGVHAAGADTIVLGGSSNPRLRGTLDEQRQDQDLDKYLRITMKINFIENKRDELFLIGRLLVMTLFVIYGLKKLMNFEATVSFMGATGLPLPALATVIAIVMEMLVGIILIIGIYTKPLAVLLGFYTLATALIGHHYWTLFGPARGDAMELFYKNLSIAGGLFLLGASGPGKYSVDGK
jgi:putative oxidoreductase